MAQIRNLKSHNHVTQSPSKVQTQSQTETTFYVYKVLHTPAPFAEFYNQIRTQAHRYSNWLKK